MLSFISEGKRGEIEKRVQFTPMDSSVFNLAFGATGMKIELSLTT
ncbi:DUF6934 family protein [Dyadobacter beijingensis]